MQYRKITNAEKLETSLYPVPIVEPASDYVDTWLEPQTCAIIQTLRQIKDWFHTPIIEDKNLYVDSPDKFLTYLIEKLEAEKVSVEKFILQKHFISTPDGFGDYGYYLIEED